MSAVNYFSFVVCTHDESDEELQERMLARGSLSGPTYMSKKLRSIYEDNKEH